MLSIPHLIIIFVVALVVFGPEKLPELARTLGKVMGEFRRATGDLRSTFEGHLRDLEREADQRRTPSGTTNTIAPPSITSVIPATPAEAAAPASPPEITPAEGTVAAQPPHESASPAAGEPLVPASHDHEEIPEKVPNGGSSPA